MKRCAFRAQRPAIGGMIGIAFDVDHLGSYILGIVADCINENAAPDRALRTSGASLLGAGDFQFLKLGIGRRQIEA